MVCPFATWALMIGLGVKAKTMHVGKDSGLLRRTVRLRSGIPFTFSPELCSSSPRNVFHVRAGVTFTLPRNPQRSGPGFKTSPDPSAR
jgi:hypothetical protein